ncbi:MAG TPA: FHA domain-containing protein [Planctomycetaceae bacterium]|nr:FHA domain-containing protein [Planctomycetaceae bacterium]
MTALLIPTLPQSQARTVHPPLVLEPPRHLDLSPTLLGPGQIRIGSGPECQIRLEINGIAAEHASIVAGTHRVILRANDPRTWLNDGPVKEAALRHGDQIALGPVSFRVRLASADELLAGWPAPDFRTVATPVPKVEAEPTPPPSATLTPVPEQSESTTSPDGEALPVGPDDTAPSHPTLIATAQGPTANDGITVGGSAEHQHDPEFAVVAEITTADVASVEPSPPTESVSESLADTLAELQRQQTQLSELRQSLADARAASRDETLHREEQFTREAVRLSRQSTELVASLADLDDRDRQLRHRSEALELREQQLRTTEAELAVRERELAAERTRITELADESRQQLQAEVVRQTAGWMAWEDQQQRLLTQVAEQSAALDEQRFALAEQQRRFNESEQELREAREDFEQQRRELRTEQERLAADRIAFHAERDKWAAERLIDRDRQQSREQWLQTQEVELKLHSEHVRRQQDQLRLDIRERARSHAERQAVDQQLQQDRRLLSEQQSSWQQERETAWQDIAERRQRLDAEADRLQSARYGIERLERVLEAEVQAATEDRARWRTELTGLASRSTPVSDSTSSEDVQAVAAENDSVDETWSPTTDEQPTTDDESVLGFDDAVSDDEELSETEGQFDADEGDASASDVAMHDVQAALDALAERFEEFSILEHRLVVRHDELLALQQDLNVREAELNAERESLNLERVTWESDRTWWDEEREALDAAAADEQVRQVAWEIARQATLAEIVAERRRWAAHLVELDGLTALPPPVPTASVIEASPISSVRDVEPVETVTPVEQDAVPPAANWLRAESPSHALPSDHAPAFDAAPEPSLETSALGEESFASVDTPQPFAMQTAMPGHDLWLAQERLQLMGLEGVTHSTSPLLDAPTDAEAHSSSLSGPDLRSQLAQMFDLPENFAAEQPPNAEPSEEVTDVETDAESDAVLTAEPALTDWRQQVSNSLAEPSEAPPEPSIAPAEETVAAFAAESEPEAPVEDDSVAAYMDRLLARTRKRTGTPEPEPTPSPAEEIHSNVDAGPTMAEVVTAPSEPAPVRAKIDRHATRAEMQSFREVANLSARSALATHSLKTTKTEIAVQVSLFVASSVGAVAFLSAPLRGAEIQLWPGLGCAITAAWMGHRVLQAWQSLQRWMADAAPAIPLAREADEDSDDVGEEPASPAAMTTEPPDGVVTTNASVPDAVEQAVLSTATVAAIPSVDDQQAPSTVESDDFSLDGVAPALHPKSAHASPTGSLWDDIWSDPTSPR